MKQDEFVTKAIESSEECDIDRLCIAWLKTVSNEYGEDGQIANKLIDIVRDILCISE